MQLRDELEVLRPDLTLCCQLTSLTQAFNQICISSKHSEVTSQKNWLFPLREQPLVKIPG